VVDQTPDVGMQMADHLLLIFKKCLSQLSSSNFWFIWLFFMFSVPINATQSSASFAPTHIDK
jgi:hypothetical protein